MPKQSSAAAPPRVDKHALEAGQQCLKRLYLDRHNPKDVEPSESRRDRSATGQRLIELARGAFPHGVAVAETTPDTDAARTAELLAPSGANVVFAATFTTPAAVARSDIVLRQKGDAVDLYEVKSGTRVKPRYLSDLAFQVHVIESAGYRVRAAHVLHLSRSYSHTEGADYPVGELFRNVDVTERVRRLVPRVAELVTTLRKQWDDDSVLGLPTGSYCRAPFPCPHLDECGKHEPEHPLYLLPELSQRLEEALHAEGVLDLTEVDPARPGLSPRQRRTLQAIQQGETRVEPYVRDELRHVEYPLHFLALADITEALPRWTGTRPWQPVPYAWAVVTRQGDGRISKGTFHHADKGDPRPDAVRRLAEHVAGQGTLVLWGLEALNSVRAMLDGLPSEKQSVRAVLARDYFDLARLLESGLFAPGLPPRRSLLEMARVLLSREDGEQLPVHDEETVYAAISRARAPRVRSTTRQKLGEELLAWVAWQADLLAELHARYAELPPPLPADSPAASGSTAQPRPRRRPPRPS